MEANFVAINYISCEPEFRNRFEELFATRKHAIDNEPGFLSMEVLRTEKEEEPYLIVSRWTDKSAFESWTKSAAFMEGHKRGFAELAKAKEEGRPAPMSSNFKVYEIISN